jgi:hypothetical protein
MRSFVFVNGRDFRVHNQRSDSVREVLMPAGSEGRKA